MKQFLKDYLRSIVMICALIVVHQLYKYLSLDVYLDEIDISFILTYIMLSLAALTAVGFGIKKMMQNTNNAKKTLYTAGGLVVAFIIAYLLASDEVLNSYEKYNTTSSSSKQVGMGLITFYLLLFGAIVAILYTELSKVFSK